MNCKKGDLAVFIGKEPWAQGMIFRIVRRMRWYDRLRYLRFVRNMPQPAWVIDPPAKWPAGWLSFFCSDEALRPLRDSDGEDEVLRLVGRPHEQREAV